MCHRRRDAGEDEDEDDDDDGDAARDGRGGVWCGVLTRDSSSGGLDECGLVEWGLDATAADVPARGSGKGGVGMGGGGGG